MAEKVNHDLLAEIKKLNAKVDSMAIHRPVMMRHGWLKHVVKGLEEDPAVQAKVHKVASYWWVINFPIVAFLFFGMPHVWITVGLLMNTFYSLYANFATDYGALSAAQASLYAKQAGEAVDEAK